MIGIVRTIGGLLAVAREVAAAKADARVGEIAIAPRCAVRSWAGDDFVRGRREGGRNSAARRAAKALRAARMAARLYEAL